MSVLTSRDHALRISVWSVIASEAIVFTGLLLVRGSVHVEPTSRAVLTATAITMLLLAGGTGLVTALRRTRDGQPEAAARLLVLAAVAGSAALALELASARANALSDPLSLVIVGLHAAHVAAGIALAIWVLALVRCGRVHRAHHDVLTLVATYWYFVAGVWLFVWPILTGLRP